MKLEYTDDPTRSRTQTSRPGEQVPNIITIKFPSVKRNHSHPKRMILIASVLPAGTPNQVHIEAIPCEITEDRVSLKWTAPKDNGARITEYTVYEREVNEDGPRSDWEGKATGPDVLQHEVVGLESGKMYEFQVTATNRCGESLRVEEGPNIVQIACGKF